MSSLDRLKLFLRTKRIPERKAAGKEPPREKGYGGRIRTNRELSSRSQRGRLGRE
jgi:hypothetical protein